MANSKNQLPTLLLGKYSSLIISLAGTSYFTAMIVLIITGNFNLPPPQWVQTFGAWVDIIISPLMIVLISSIFYTVHEDKKVKALIGLIFSSLFTVVVCINRISQLTIITQRIASGDIDGINWFLPYEPTSVMFTLEIMGFSFFLSIALFFVALSLSSGKQKYIRVFLYLYSFLGIVSFTGFLMNSLMVNAGFIAWGLVLYIGTWLLYKDFSSQYYLTKDQEN